MEGQEEVSETVLSGKVSGFMFPWDSGRLSFFLFIFPPSFLTSSHSPPFPCHFLSLSFFLSRVVILIADSWRQGKTISPSLITLVLQALVSLYHKYTISVWSSGTYLNFLYLCQNLIQFWGCDSVFTCLFPFSSFFIEIIQLI